MPFSTTPVADTPFTEESSFAFAIPLSCAMQTAYHALRVITPSGGLLTRNAGPGEIFQMPTATPLGQGMVRIQWDPKAFPTAMVRNVANHEVLAFAHSGLLDLATSAKALEVTLSDGVRSKRLLLPTGE